MYLGICDGLAMSSAEFRGSRFGYAGGVCWPGRSRRPRGAAMTRLAVAVGLVLAAAVAAAAQPLAAALYAPLKWRCIGPFRAGRTVGATGVPGKPNLFYVGVNNGGVWKTTDAGRVWTPIFDDQPTGSVGCLAVAPSNP